MMFGYGWDGGLGGWIMMLGGIVLLVAIVLLVVWGVTAATRAGQGPASRDAEPDRALAILRERFARGEITEAEYEQARKTLGG